MSVHVMFPLENDTQVALHCSPQRC